MIPNYPDGGESEQGDGSLLRVVLFILIVWLGSAALMNVTTTAAGHTTTHYPKK